MNRIITGNKLKTIMAVTACAFMLLFGSAGAASAKTTRVSPNGYFTDTVANKYTGLYYTHSSVFEGCDILTGVDVSRHNGTINWDQVKADGVDFAILRIGYSRLNTDLPTKPTKKKPGPLRMVKDENYDKNLAGAQRVGMPIGIYYFAQSVTVQEAEQEADYVLSLLNGMKVDLPVVFDSEMTPGGRLAKVNPNKAEYTKIAKAFCEKIKAAGYTPMVYSSYYGWRGNYDAAELEDLYGIWLARYNTNTFYDGRYDIWQFTSTGKVAGIPGSVDMNFLYQKKEESLVSNPVDETKRVANVKAQTLSASSVGLTFSGINGAAGYEISRSESYDGPFEAVATTDTTSYTDTGLASGTEYYYRVAAKFNADGTAVTGPASASARGVTKKTTKTVITLTLASNLRKHAGSNHPSLGFVADGTKLTVIAKTKNIDGITWYRVKADINGTPTTGYVSRRCSTVSVGTVKNVKQKGSKKSTSVSLKWDAAAGADAYEIWYAESSAGKYTLAGQVSGKTSFTHKKLKKYTEYYYKVRAVCHVDDKVYTGNYSSKVLLSTKNVKYKYKTTGAVAMRSAAGTSYKKLCVVPGKTKVTVYYQTKDKAGTVWYHVKAKVKGKSYNGYISTKYLKKA